MLTEDQQQVIDFLAAPATHGGRAVERIDTHASIVFLAGARAWKLKRAVRYDYLDYSTSDRRHAMCDAEVRVNRRTAPALYRGVVAVTREGDGTLALGGNGVPVDWVVEMVRFDEEQLLDRLAARKALPLDLMTTLAAAIVDFHVRADVRRDAGGGVAMRTIIENNATDLAAHAGVLDGSRCRALADRSRDALQRVGALLDARRDAGLVRHCHGDLHLRNIVLLDGAPTLFDAVEFNDDISCIDVLYDLAFLLMDLWHRELQAHANAVWNVYIAASGDVGGVPLLPLFLSCRAAILAKTNVTAASLDSEADQGQALEQRAREYLALSARLLQPPPPCVVAIGGLSGSGKSLLARALAPYLGGPPGALVLRSDEVRKRLCGVAPTARLGADGYTAAVSQRVYQRVVEQALTIASGGIAAIADAVFLHTAERQQIAHAARDAAIPFVGLWLDAPERLLLERVSSRTRDPSDADAAVVRQQLTQEAGAIEWHRIDAAGNPADVARRAADIVRAAVGHDGP